MPVRSSAYPRPPQPACPPALGKAAPARATQSALDSLEREVGELFGELRAPLETVPQTPTNAHRVDVAGELFELSEQDLLQRGGYLRHVFCDDFYVPLDEHGAYRLPCPSTTCDAVRLVAQKDAGDLPNYLVPETAARAVSAAEKRHLPERVFEVGRRTVELAQQSDRLLRRFAEQAQSLLQLVRPNVKENSQGYCDDRSELAPVEGWEPFAATLDPSSARRGHWVDARRPLRSARADDALQP